MAKDNGGPGWLTFLYELLKTEIYKRSQGRMVRQFTCLAIWAVFLLAAYRMYGYLRVVPTGLHPSLNIVIPSVFLVVGLWLGFRVVNLPSFADFLIAVEAEMNKVSWPSRTELIRASVVVIVLMFGLTAVLYFYDIILNVLLKSIGVVAV